MNKFLLGLGTGIVIGLISAPASGKHTRARLLRLRGREQRYLWRDPENRLACSEREIREKMMDKTIADSFPASDPPSSIPDPAEDSLIA